MTSSKTTRTAKTAKTIPATESVAVITEATRIRAAIPLNQPIPAGTPVEDLAPVHCLAGELTPAEARDILGKVIAGTEFYSVDSALAALELILSNKMSANDTPEHIADDCWAGVNGLHLLVESMQFERTGNLLEHAELSKPWRFGPKVTRQEYGTRFFKVMGQE